MILDQMIFGQILTIKRGKSVTTEVRITYFFKRMPFLFASV